MQDVLQRAGSPGPFAEGAALPISATIGGYVKPGFEKVKEAFGKYTCNLQLPVICRPFFFCFFVAFVHSSSGFIE